MRRRVAGPHGCYCSVIYSCLRWFNKRKRPIFYKFWRAFIAACDLRLTASALRSFTR